MPVSISGLASEIDTQALIEKLVELERRPIKRLEEERELQKLRVEVLEMMSRDFKRLRDSLRPFLGPGSVLRRKTALGTDDRFFTVTPGENAVPGQYKLEILRIAQAHSVASDPFPESTPIPPGTFRLSLGTNTRTVDFPGGSVFDLASAINRQAPDLASAAAVRDTPTTVVLQLVAKNTGKTHRLAVPDDPGPLAAIPLLKPRHDASLRLDRSTGFGDTWQDYAGVRKELSGLPGQARTSDDRAFRVHRKAVERPIEPVTVKADTVLEISGAYEPAPTQPPPEQPPQAEQTLVSTRLFPVRVQEWDILGGPIPINDSPEPQQHGTQPTPDLSESGVGVASLRNGRRAEKLFPIDPTPDGSWSLTIPLDKGPDRIDRIVLYSPHPDRVLRIDSIRIRSTSAQGLDFARTLQEPADALFKINDLEIERPVNDPIRDVIPHTVLGLKAPTPAPVTFTIDHAIADMQRDLTTFVSNYNLCIGALNQVSKSTPVDRPGEYDRSQQGLFLGDSAFINIRTRMRTIVTAAYPTSASNALCLPSQIGLSTGEWGTALADVRSGRLRFDPRRFEEQFRRYPTAVAELFASDTDGDRRPDNGLAVRLDAFLYEVVRPKAGILDVKIAKTREDIREKNRQINRKEEQVQNYERKLQERFGDMEREMSDLKSQQRWIDQRLNQGQRKND